MILKALDLALMMWLYEKIFHFALAADHKKLPEAPKLARLAINAETTITKRLLSASSATAGLATAIVGESSGYWKPMVEAMRARDEGRAIGKLK